MFSLFRSGKSVIKWTKLPVKVSTHSLSYRTLVSLSLGSNNTPSSSVLTTFTVIVTSSPSASANPLLYTYMPALQTSTSRRSSSDSARAANARTLACEARSRGHTETTDSRSDRCGKEARMEAAAASPFVVLRTARMTREALRRTRWRAASRPMPVLEPVTITVWPAKDLVGMGSLVKSWDLRYCLILGQVISAILGIWDGVSCACCSLCLQLFFAVSSCDVRLVQIPTF